MVYIERAMRRIPVQYAKRMAGRTMFAGQATYFPMKVNTSGVIPPIFAGAILSFPATLGNWLPGLATVQHALESNAWLYDGVFVLLIIFFTYFYTTLTFRADDVADNIKKQGGYIPGIRPGRQTAEYISGVLNRITFGGAIYLAVICVIPSILSNPAFGGLALPVRRHRAADRRGRGAGHRAADRGAPHQPQLRGLRRGARSADPRSSAAGRLRVVPGGGHEPGPAGTTRRREGDAGEAAGRPLRTSRRSPPVTSSGRR